MQEPRREELERAWQAWLTELFAETSEAAGERDVRTPVPVREAA